NRLEFVRASDVHQCAVFGQPQFHSREQTVPAGQGFGVLYFREHLYRFVQRFGTVIVKGTRPHRSFSPLACRTFHILRGVSGIPRCFTPNRDRASTTAFTNAGVEAMVPVSPAPLTPSGLTGDGVSVRSSSNVGSRSARGRAASISEPLTSWPLSS